MILFKITSCPDKSQIGIYQHENTTLTIGTNADMIVDDPDLDEQQIEIRQEDGKFVIQNLSPKVEVKLNGAKLAKKAMPIKSNDSVTMGSSQIYFTQINDRPMTPPSPWNNENIQSRLTKTDSDEYAIQEGLKYLAEHTPAGIQKRAAHGNSDGDENS